MRIIVNNPEQAVSLLKGKGFTANITHVVAVEIEDHPGGLANVLEIITESQLNVEYMYGFMERIEGKAIMVLRFENPEQAGSVLKSKGINVLSSDLIQ